MDRDPVPVEFKAFRTLYFQLHTGISSSLEDLVAPAYSEGLIGEHVNQAASSALQDRNQRTTEFLNAVQKQVKVDPPAFDKFLNILSQDRVHEHLAEKLKAERAKEAEHAKRRKDSEASLFRQVPTTSLRTSPVTERPQTLMTNAPCPFQQAELGSLTVTPGTAGEQRRARTSVLYRGSLTPPNLPVGYEYRLPGKGTAWARQIAQTYASLPPAKESSRHSTLRPEPNSEPVLDSGTSIYNSGAPPVQSQHPSIVHTAPTPTVAKADDTGDGIDSKDSGLLATDSREVSTGPDSKHLCPQKQLSTDSLSSQSSDEEFHSAPTSLEFCPHPTIGQPVQETVNQIELAAMATTVGGFPPSVETTQSKELERLLEKAPQNPSKMKRREALMKERDELRTELELEKERSRNICAQLELEKETSRSVYAQLLHTQECLGQQIATLEAQLQMAHWQLEIHKQKSFAFDAVYKNDCLEKKVQQLNDMMNGFHAGYRDELEFPAEHTHT